MVSPIDKTDPKLFRVQETLKDRDRRGQQQEEEEERPEKERDEFDKGKQNWRKLMPPIPADQGGTLAKKWPVRTKTAFGDEDQETSQGTDEKNEASLSLSERLFVLWGVLDVEGRPRLPVIVTYALVTALTLISLGMIVGLLWR
jgi:hypothetical protein